ncbi:tandem-95 repeat protein [Candidatus Halobeggiatoa sp. HSG11]|nr:tandem-95 repeat protein [Candidatus Halobeggiatoa sp. HSG11]
MLSIKYLIKNVLIFIILLSSCIFISSANAEGSRELVADGGYRPYLEFSGRKMIGIELQTIIKVYVNAGEQINLGSSVPNSSTSIPGNTSGDKDIVYRSPLGGQNGSCDVLATGFGLIDTLTKEQAGPLPNSNGYTPCNLTATETGVYEIEFRAPYYNPTNSKTYKYLKRVLTNKQFPIDDNQAQAVAAWDVTIFDTTGTEQKGRAYSNYLALDVGGKKRKMNSKTYFLTKDGYLYLADLNGMEPHAFVYFGNNEGIKGPDDESLYKSAEKTIAIHNPKLPDTETDITHKLFFNLPNHDLPLDQNVDTPNGETWLRSTTKTLPIVDNFKFTGNEGSNGYAGTVPLKGTFSFNSDSELKFFLTIDLNNNSIYGDDVDVTLPGKAVIGANKMEWDGRDGLGNPAPPKEATYNAKFNFLLGDIHFPFWDVENDPNGFIVKRINCTADCDIIYYNHSDVTINGTPPTQISALNGVHSEASSKVHAFSDNFGDKKLLDIWAFPNVDQSIEVETNFQLKEANISVSKTHTTDVKPLHGGPVTYIITVKNSGPSDATDIRVQDNLPATVNDPLPLWVCEVSNSIKPPPAIQNSCSKANGEGAIDITVDLQNGASATFEVVGTITADVGDTVTNSVSVTRPNDVNNPQGDITSATHSFIVAPPDNEPPTAVDKVATTDNTTPVQIPTLEATDTDGTIASYTVYDIPTTQGSLYLGDPNTGTLITEGQVLTPNDISNIYFLPNINTTGEVVFHYTATDDKGDTSNQANVTITVIAPPANEPPVADNKNVDSTPNDSNVKVDDLSATDPDGTVDFFNVTLPPSSQGVLYLGDPDNGGTPISAGQELSPSEISNIHFKPNPSFTGQAQFTYIATDNNGSESVPATVTIPVTDSNQSPVAEDKQAPSVPNNVTEQIPALEATDVDGTVESYQIKTLPPASEGKLYLEDPAKGGKPISVNETLTPEQAKSLFFQPNTSFSGDASFTFAATDNNGAVSNIATVSIPVTMPSNNQPITSDDSSTTDPNTPVTIDILGNDSDPENNFNLSTLAVTSQPSNGSIVINPDGSVTYTPNNGFNNGTDSFTYRVCDSGVPPLCDTATVTVTIPTQQPPIVDDKTAENTSNNTTVQLPPLSATDVDGTVTSYNIATLPPTEQGVLYLGDPDNGGTLVTEFQQLTPAQVGNLYFKPNGKFIGDASFTYTATDDQEAVSSPALVTIPVAAAVNVIPTANNDMSTTDIATPVTIDILDNDSDPEGGLNIESVTITTPPPHGTVTVNDDGTVTYTPDDDFTKGIDVFTYEVCDTGVPVQCDTAEVSVVVPILDDFPPTAEKITSPAIPNNITTKLPSLAATDDGSVASYNIDTLPPVSQGIIYLGDPDNGGVPITAGQELTPEQISQIYFQPNENFVGNANFSYTATDDKGNVSTPALVVVPVIEASTNQDVVANDDNSYTDPETPVTINVIGNDSDPEGNLDAENLIITTQPSKGTVVANGDGTVTYTPEPGFTFGTDEFTYQICDFDFPTSCDTATVTVLVPTLEDPPPTVTNQTAEPTTNDVTTLLPSLAGEDNGTIVSYTVKTLPEQGKLYLGNPASGGIPIQPGQILTPEQAAQVFFEPAADFVGNASFTFTATDDNGSESSPGLMTIPVTSPDNSPPNANDDDAGTKPDIPVSINVLKNDSDPNDNLNPHSLTIVGQPSNGTVKVNLDTGEVEYTPKAGFEGTDSFVYQICDTDQVCDTATVNITVSNEIEEPTDDVKLIVTISGKGKVEGVQDLSCNNNNDPCQQPYATGTDVTLTPTPDAGWVFDGWRGHCGADGNVTMNDFKSCKAVFVPDDIPQVSLDVSRNGSGSITSQPTGIECKEDCTEDYAQGTEVELVANPEPGFAFTHWSGDCSGINKTITVLMDQAKSCQANFALDGDGDGVATDIEENAPNNGDGNDDGIPDWKQNNVVSLMTPDGKYVTIVEKNGCTINNVQLSEPGLTDDSSLVPFPFDLDMSCTDADLEVFYHDADDVDLHRQYADGKWQDLPVTLGNKTVGDKTVSTASFRLSDGKLGDNSDISGHITHTSGRAFVNDRVQWADSSYTVDEFGNVATVAVQRLGNCEGKVTVDYAAIDNTAQSPDYTAKQGTITWEDGDCSDKFIGIPITNDTASEDDEIIDLVLSNAGGGASIVSPETATLTIIDDDSSNSCHSFPTCQVCCPTCQLNTAFNVKSLSIILRVGESTEMTLANGQSELLIKDIPDNSLVSLDAWRSLNAGAAELELTGVKVGDTKMVISDSANPLQTITIYIKVIEDANGSLINLSGSKFRIKAMHTTVKVGQSLDLTVAGGEGELTISEIPDRNILLLENWTSLSDSGSAMFTLTGLKVGQSKIVISDHAIPPQKTSVDLIVVARDVDYNQGDSDPDDKTPTFNGNSLIDAANQYKIDNGLVDGTEKTGSGLIIGKTGDLVINDNCTYGLEVSVQGNITSSEACFLDKLNASEMQMANHSRLTYTDANTVNLSSTVNIAPQHVGQVADVLLIGTYSNIFYDVSYYRNEQSWQEWDGKLSSLPTAQYYPQLTEQIEIFIYEDELDFVPGEFIMFVGYRLRNGTIVFNGLEPMHFFIGNSGSVEPQQNVTHTDLQVWNDVASTSIFASSITNQNGRTGNDLTFAYHDAIDVSGFISVEPRYVGLPADILIAAGYRGHYWEQAYARNEASWQFWDHSLDDLYPIQHYHRLPDYLEVPTYIDNLIFRPGYYQMFIGYRLEDDVVVFNGYEPMSFMIANGIGLNASGEKFVTTSRFLNWGYQDEKRHNPFFANANSQLGIATTIVPEAQHVGQNVEIIMAAVPGQTNAYQEEVSTWGTWSSVYKTVSIPNVILEGELKELVLFEGSFESGTYTVYVGYKLPNGDVIYNGGEALYLHID